MICLPTPSVHLISLSRLSRLWWFAYPPPLSISSLCPDLLGCDDCLPTPSVHLISLSRPSRLWWLSTHPLCPSRLSVSTFSAVMICLPTPSVHLASLSRRSRLWWFAYPPPLSISSLCPDFLGCDDLPTHPLCPSHLSVPTFSAVMICLPTPSVHLISLSRLSRLWWFAYPPPLSISSLCPNFLGCDDLPTHPLCPSRLSAPTFSAVMICLPTPSVHLISLSRLSRLWWFAYPPPLSISSLCPDFLGFDDLPTHPLCPSRLSVPTFSAVMICLPTPSVHLVSLSRLSRLWWFAYPPPLSISSLCPDFLGFDDLPTHPLCPSHLSVPTFSAVMICLPTPSVHLVSLCGRSRLWWFAYPPPLSISSLCPDVLGCDDLSPHPLCPSHLSVPTFSAVMLSTHPLCPSRFSVPSLVCLEACGVVRPEIPCMSRSHTFLHLTTESNDTWRLSSAQEDGAVYRWANKGALVT